ncbi:MAG: CHRD domain-containing protein [Actinomycetota bacterium]
MKRILAIAAVALLAVAIVALPHAWAGGRPFDTTLTGAAERPGPGDPDGFGTAHLELNQGQGTVCWEISLSNVDPLPFGGHIHIAGPDDPGPIVLTLLGAPANAEPTTTPDAPTSYPASACVENVDAGLIKDIRQSPDEYYVNLHNEPFPNGAVRGQLSK